MISVIASGKPYLLVATSCSCKKTISKESRVWALLFSSMPRVRRSHIHEPSHNLVSQTYLACCSEGCYAAAHGRTGQTGNDSAWLKAAQLPWLLCWRGRWEAPHNPILAHNCAIVQHDIRQTDVSALMCLHRGYWRPLSAACGKSPDNASTALQSLGTCLLSHVKHVKP